jgi:hypothetical protein
MDIISRAEAKAQGLTHYFTGKPCKNGHVAKRLVAGACVECRLLWGQAHDDRRRQRRQQDPDFDAQMREKQRKAAAAFTQRNPERRQELRDAWAAVPENKQHRYQYCQLLKKTPKHLATARARRAIRYATDPAYVVTARLRARMHTALNAVLARKGSASLQLLGCSWQQVAAHLDAQFASDMTWESYGEWHIDHIRPCSSFDLTDPSQQRACFNWRNLQPLWGAENLTKSDVWTPAMEAEWAQNMRELGWEGELFLVFEQELAA